MTGATPDAGVLLAVRARLAHAAVSRDQLAHLDRAVAIATGVVCDARSDDDRVVPGQRVAVTLECWNTGDATRTVTATLRAAKGFSLSGGAQATLRLDPGALAASQVTAVVAPDAPATVPYFRLGSRGAEYYDWSAAPPVVRGEPFGPPALVGSVRDRGRRGGDREVTLRLNDQARGEIRRPVTVVPRVGVAPRPCRSRSGPPATRARAGSRSP